VEQTKTYKLGFAPKVQFAPKKFMAADQITTDPWKKVKNTVDDLVGTKSHRSQQNIRSLRFE